VNIYGKGVDLFPVFLPDEVHIEILSYLEDPVDILAFKATCKEAYRLTNDYQLWKAEALKWLGIKLVSNEREDISNQIPPLFKGVITKDNLDEHPEKILAVLNRIKDENWINNSHLSVLIKGGACLHAYKRAYILGKSSFCTELSSKTQHILKKGIYCSTPDETNQLLDNWLKKYDGNFKKREKLSFERLNYGSFKPLPLIFRKFIALKGLC